MAEHDSTARPSYALGHSPNELARLGVQARTLEPITRRLLAECGIGPAMRVLDVGTGIGDVAILAAEFVGEQGEVIGVDRSAAAVATARDRAAEKSLTNLSFVDGDAAEMAFNRPFDAVVARYVVTHQPDSSALLEALAVHLAPGGVLVCQEPDWSFMRSAPPVESWDRCCRLVVETMGAGGAEMFMGLKLHAAFVRAGLPEPALHMETIVGSGSDSFDQVHLTTDLLVTLLADAEKLGLVTPGEIDPEALANRVLTDVAASDSVIIGRSDVGAWSRIRPPAP